MTFAIHNLGCKVNTYETDAMICRLKEAGYEEVDFSERADIYIINTCTVTNVADKKSRQMLHRARKMNENALVVAAGCYVDAALKNEDMRKLFSDSSVDIFLPNREKINIVERIESFLAEKKVRAWHGVDMRGTGLAYLKDRESSSPSVFGCAESSFGKAVTEIESHTRAFIKIQDGCNQFCSYCIIPYVRGRIVSRAPEDCVEEIRGLAEKGIKEVVLTGIHLSSYGKDLSGKGGGPVADEDFKDRIYLLELIKDIHRIEGIERIRIGSLEPHIVTEEFASELSKLEKFCPHFHLSLQSGSDSVLRRMNRHYSAEDYRKRCEILRRYFEHPAITTDVIAGFPGETEEEFRETLSFARGIRFYEMHVFKYSRRAGTLADRMEGQVPEEVKSARSEALIKLADRMSEEFRAYYLGKELAMLPEETVEVKNSLGETERYVTGYTKEYVRTVIKADDFEKGRIIKGKASEICKEKAIYESILLR